PRIFKKKKSMDSSTFENRTGLLFDMDSEEPFISPIPPETQEIDFSSQMEPSQVYSNRYTSETQELSQHTQSSNITIPSKISYTGTITDMDLSAGIFLIDETYRLVFLNQPTFQYMGLRIGAVLSIQNVSQFSKINLKV
ncbi:hypothetical protein HK096_002966, partial [Nowakowskiella sp. JEL0078]